MKKYLLFIIILLISGCVTAISQDGMKVRLIDKQSDYKCKFVAVVTASNSMGNNEGHDAEGAMNEVRNKAAMVGANSVRIVEIDTSVFATTVVGEALNCEFK